MDTTQMNPATPGPERPQQPDGRAGSAGTKAARNAPPERRKAQTASRTATQSKTGPQKVPTAAGAKQAPQRKRQVPEAGKKAPQARKPSPKQEAARPQRRKSPVDQEPAYTQGLPDSVSTKKRAYGQSKPKKKTVLDLVNDAVKRSGARKVEKIKKRQANMEKGVPKKSSPIVKTQAGPVVVYTQPAAFNASRLLVHMATVVAVVLALVWGLSVFFKVETITVSGAEVYTPWTIREASGIKEGDNLLTFSHARAGAQIKANLPYVKTVRFGIKLPDTVNIIIEEEDVMYAIKTQDGTWWLMSSTGRMVEQTNSAVAAKYTQILGVTVTDPVVNERAVATESAAVYETDEAGETVPVPVAVTGAARLNTALKIVQALEDNDIVGDAASVDVSRIQDIILWYGTQYQVNLGDSSNLDYKIACMNDVILQMQEYQTGVLDISFTIWPNEVGFTPFG